jgi:hypothetical protein
MRIQKFLKGGFPEVKLFIFVKFSWTKFMIKQYYTSQRSILRGVGSLRYNDTIQVKQL